MAKVDSFSAEITEKLYQAWSSGLNEKISGSSGPTTSNLDPNSKPFAPRQVFSNGENIPAKQEDENKNVVRTNHEDKMRKIWPSTGHAARHALKYATTGPPPVPATSVQVKPDERLNLSNLQGMQVVNQDQRLNLSNLQGLQVAKQHQRLNLSNLNVENKNIEVKLSLQQKNGRHLTQDDYGMRALMQNLCVAAASMKSETSSVFKHEDLGFTEEVRQRIKKPNYAYASMESPFTHQFVGPMSGYIVPNEYNHRLGSKGILAQPTLPKMATDTLFVMFYLCPKELLQLDVAAELFNRGWRYHKIFKRWVARLPNVNPSVRHDKYEQGEYQYFDPGSWSRERKFMILEYAALAKHAKK